MSRHNKIRAEKTKAEAKGHEMGDVTTVSPLHTNPLPEWTVLSRCRRCGRIMYVEKQSGEVKSWGSALEGECHAARPQR